MIRVQVQLDPRQHRRVKQQARRLGVSVAEVVRRCLDRHLDDEGQAPAERIRRALAVLGGHAEPGGAARTGRDHDAALADAFRR
jgi:hypothetical protein